MARREWVVGGADGVDNLAPHSFFTVASADPPVVQFTSVGRKDTLRNIEATGDFVVMGTVVHAAVSEEVLDGDHPEVTRLAPLSRLGREEWCTLGEVRSIPRPRSG